MSGTFKHKEYLPIIVITTLFLVIVVYSLIVLSRKSNEVAIGDEEINLNLPVIEWTAYQKLSKKLKTDIIEPLN